ncbi:archaellin/type IV pilin N-terminal domain-containing protein [Caldivirga sp.]|uniref:archaellin/type IV pilin N-terminal domain-containing protein n=1 Tax=Caldivirga sp. TaxID=2080243 RepID=UPI003D0C9FB8
MSNPNSRRVRKGIEPIVAAILLIVITVVAAILLYFWFSGYLSTTTTRVSQISAPEEAQIIGVNYNPSSRQLIVYVQNVGQIPITINQAYILDSTTLNVICTLTLTSYSSPPSATSTTAPASGVTLTYGNSAALYFLTSACSLSPNSLYVIKLVTAKGTQITYQFST